MNFEKVKQKMLNKHNSILIFVFILFLFGLFFRLQSISHEASYWNDESHVAVYGRAITETGQAIDPTGYSTGIYQIALYYITALSFFIIGLTEFAGRLPSALTGALLIPVIYFVTKKLMGEREGIVASFLMAFSQMQFAWSTQLRPYIYMELFTLLLIFLVFNYLKERAILNKFVILAFLVSILSLLFHGTGIYNIAILSSAFLYKIIKFKKWKYIAVLFIAGSLAIYIISLTPFFNLNLLLKFNTYFVHYRVFLTHNYLWLIAGSLIGFIYLYLKQKKELAFLLGLSIAFIILFSMLKVHDRYIRYSITAFPLLYILFSIGLVGIFKEIFKQKISFLIKTFLSFVVVFLGFYLPIKDEKIILTPKKYYSLNADMRENPIVDYKTAFKKIEIIAKGKEKTIFIGDAWYDRILWYLPDFKNYYWLMVTDSTDRRFINNISYFQQIKAQYISGIVIVENWESMTPPDLQEHIRKTLKFEFTQDTVPGNEKDPWSISVYSWGLD